MVTGLGAHEDVAKSRMARPMKCLVTIRREKQLFHTRASFPLR